MYTFLLFGWDGLADNDWWTLALGIVFIMGMTWICVVGIELSARSQMVLLVIELAVLVLFCVVGAGQGVRRRHPRFGHPVVVVADADRTSAASSALADGHPRRRVPLLGLGHRDQRQRGVHGLEHARPVSPA